MNYVKAFDIDENRYAISFKNIIDNTTAYKRS